MYPLAIFLSALVAQTTCLNIRGYNSFHLDASSKRESDPGCDRLIKFDDVLGPLCAGHQFTIDSTGPNYGSFDTWTVVTYEVPPFLFPVPSDESHEGAIPSILMLLSERLNVRFVVDSYTEEEAPIDQLLDLVEYGKYDLAIGPLLGTLNERKGIRFTKPLMADTPYALVPRNFDQRGVSTVEDIIDRGLFVGGVKGSVHADWLDNEVGVRGRHVDSVEEGLDWLTRKPWAFILDGFTAKYINNQPPCNTKLININGDIFSHKIAVSKKSQQADLLNMAILLLNEEGAIQYVINKQLYIDTDNDDNSIQCSY